MEGEAPRFFKPTGKPFIKEFVLFRWRATDVMADAIYYDGYVNRSPVHVKSYFDYHIKRGELEEITEAEAALILSLIPPLRYGK